MKYEIKKAPKGAFFYIYMIINKIIMKKTLFTIMFCCIVFACEEVTQDVVGCVDSQACNYNPEATLEDECIYPQVGYDCNGLWIGFEIGQDLNGGIIFYIDETGEHGLVMAKENTEFSPKWGCQDGFVGGTDVLIGTGRKNTELIIESCGENIIAARLCANYQSEGFVDWFLPSKDELNLIFENIAVPGLEVFEQGAYWSSSEVDANKAWLQVMSNGIQDDYYEKSNYFHVRPVKEF